ncbi:MAG: hypothetical protein ABIN37_13365 [Burkholderiaceae bacterium]
MTNGESKAIRRWRPPALARAVTLLALICIQSAHALSIRELRALEQSDKKHGPNYVQYYLVGAMEGALEANSQSVRAGAKAFFCLNGRRLEPRMAQPLFDAELRRNAGIYEADMPVQLVLFNALVTSYSC